LWRASRVMRDAFVDSVKSCLKFGMVIVKASSNSSPSCCQLRLLFCYIVIDLFVLTVFGNSLITWLLRACYEV
jgi:hypothetical protein